MPDTPAVDPRYNPAYQRGYTPREGAVTSDAAAAPSAISRPAPVTPRVTSALDSRVVAPVSTSAPAAAEATAAAEAPSVVTVSAPEARAPWTNPFVGALALLGFGTIGLGVWIMQSLSQEANGGILLGTQSGYVLFQVAVFGAPISVAVGVLIIATVLVLFAVHWSRMPRHDD